MKPIRPSELMTIVCILACWAFPSSIMASVEVDGIFYELNTSAKTAAVASNPDKYTGAIDIPSSFVYNGDTYNVKSISSSAFLSCSELASINFPSSVTTIGSSAFERCTGLTDVVIGSGVTFIDYEAFNNCSNLRSLTLPSSLKTIENETFSGCTSLLEIIAKRTTPPTIVSTTFDGVDKTACIVYVPDGCQSAYAKATNWKTFSNIVELTVVATGSCGDNVTYTIYSDKSMVISGMGAMTNFIINYDDDSINRENNDFWTQVKTVTIEEGVTSIGNFAFLNCAELTSVSIPNSVTSIGTFAFLGCSVLTSITIPASVETIGADALSYTGLTHIYIEDCDDVLQFEKVAFDMEDYEDPLEYVYLGRNITTIDFYEYNPWEGVEGYPPFSRSSNLHTLEIGDKVTYLEDWSFSSAPLRSLVIGRNVQSIGTRALSSANVGQTLVIPSNVKRIGDYSLSPSISTLVLEKGSDDLELFAGYNSLELSFYGSESSIDSIYVGRNLTCSSNNIHVVCRSACFDATLHRTMNTSGEEDEFDLTEYYIPPVCATNYYFRSGASFGEYYFQNSPVVHVYNLRSSRVGNFAFFNSNVKTVSFDADGSTTIGNGVFFGCEGLTTLSFPEGMIDLGNSAFMDCYGLTSITIPSSLKSIGGYCFLMDDTERNVSFNVYISDLSAWCSMDIGWGGSPLIWGHLIYNGEEISNLVVPDDVQSIGMGAFDGCSSLTSVVIPESVTSIGDRAFSYTGLISVTVERSVPLTIEGSTFEGVDKTNCILYVPAGSKTAYEDAEYWSEFENIEEYTPAPEVLATGSCGDNVTYTIYSSMTMVISGTGAMDDADGQIYGWETINNVIIEDGVTTIGDCVFEGWTSLTSVTIPNSVTRIGQASFYGCTSLTSVTMGNGVTEIGGAAFSGCTSLTSINIPNSVTNIGSEAFYNTAWYNNQPDGLVYAGNVAYEYKGEMYEGTSITIRNGTVSISSYAFSGCTGLTSVTIPNSMTSIGEFAFDGCSKLTSLMIPNGVTGIARFAFFGCTGLTSISIPRSVIGLGEYAFGGCSNLNSITVESEIPIVLGSRGQFRGVDKEVCTLYVPIGSKSAYKNDIDWGEFENIVEVEFDTDISSLDNSIYVENVEGRIGGTMDIPVKLKNNYPVRGFVFTLELPEGSNINSWKLSTTRLPSGATLSDKFSTQKIEGNKINVACSLNYGDATFTGNDGEIATVNVTFANDMEVGEYPIYLTACDISDAGGTDNKLSDIKATLVLEDYVEGDANGDGVVLIGDVIAILNYIVGVTSNNFNEKAADVNGDGEILIGDVIAVLNIIVSQ